MQLVERHTGLFLQCAPNRLHERSRLCDISGGNGYVNFEKVVVEPFHPGSLKRRSRQWFLYELSLRAILQTQYLEHLVVVNR